MTAADGLLAVVGPLVFVALALHTTFGSGLLRRSTQWLPTTVDASLAAISVIASILVLDQIDNVLPFKLFDSKMMSSAVVFCTNPTPPAPHAFIACTASAFVAGVVLHYLATLGLYFHQDGVAVGLHVLFSKLSGNSFSATIGLVSCGEEHRTHKRSQALSSDHH